MLYRSIYPQLIAWKLRANRKPLVLRGARQVGKTFLIRDFANSEFSHLLELNLEKPNHRRIFSEAESIQDIILGVQAEFNCKLDANTLLFIDEVQAGS